MLVNAAPIFHSCKIKWKSFHLRYLKMCLYESHKICKTILDWLQILPTFNGLCENVQPHLQCIYLSRLCEEFIYQNMCVCFFINAMLTLMIINDMQGIDVCDVCEKQWQSPFN